MTIEVEVVDALAVSVTAVPIGRKYDGLTRTVSLDRTITLRPFIWNGTNPKFSWTIDGQEVGTELSYTYTPTETGIKKIVFTVTDTTDEPEMTLSKCITRTNETRATLEFTVECHSEEESHRRPASGASSATWDGCTNIRRPRDSSSTNWFRADSPVRKPVPKRQSPTPKNG